MLKQGHNFYLMQCIVSESIFQLIKWSQKAPQPTKFTLNVIPQNEGGPVAFLWKRHSSKNQTFKQNLQALTSPFRTLMPSE